nr:hypothetical protein [uncultured Porphyromonas sp.]
MKHEEYQRPLARPITLPTSSSILVSFSATGEFEDFEDLGEL